jgi:hypothetical protein
MPHIRGVAVERSCTSAKGNTMALLALAIMFIPWWAWLLLLTMIVLAVIIH